MAKSLRIFSTLAVQGAMPALAGRYEEMTSATLAIRLRADQWVDGQDRCGRDGGCCHPDARGCGAAGNARCAGSAERGSMWRGRMSGSRCGRARVSLILVRPEALKAALLAAKSIAYSRIGASGILFAGLIRQLGIADAVNAKATIIPGGFTGELAARGEVELAVQQVSELMVVPGVDVVGRCRRRCRVRRCSRRVCLRAPICAMRRCGWSSSSHRRMRRGRCRLRVWSRCGKRGFRRCR